MSSSILEDALKDERGKLEDGTADVFTLLGNITKKCFVFWGGVGRFT